MRYKKIDIEYWTYPEGDDFKDISEFAKGVDQDYLLTLSKKRTDACGGGLYDLIIKVTEDISLLDLAKSYAEDGVKVAIGYSLKKMV
ncbi:hypothetical protein GCM10027275_49070 [Rhabdobacter roseus]|uniref:Uncharacterized protein n=1 Tax=Rhabdobacter roseus TaxID=1655419 RepID=A0A840TSP4_9BACT|nr:hypothetical protein [Rhabdobacter roseus]MBB5286971.1 hypothetical protein [Rhabdobacter roseus]